jgi:hypothetical protein
MKTKQIFNLFLMLVFFSFLTVSEISAQVESKFTPVKFGSRNLGGPRLGFTYVPGHGELATTLRDKQIGPLLSQFGWHFEYQIVPDIEGPCFIIEAIPLVAGVEYGTLIPSMTLGFGIRFPNGIEFGMGPNILGTESGVMSALMIAVGKSFDYGGVSIPVNLAVTTNPKGYRVSFIFGYAIEKSNNK